MDLEGNQKCARREIDGCQSSVVHQLDHRHYQQHLYSCSFTQSSSQPIRCQQNNATNHADINKRVPFTELLPQKPQHVRASALTKMRTIVLEDSSTPPLLTNQHQEQNSTVQMYSNCFLTVIQGRVCPPAMFVHFCPDSSECTNSFT